MPFKANASRRHHIPRQRHRVRNWAEYDAGLRARGSLTVWFTREAVERWRAEMRTTPGGQRTYSDLAITAALTLRPVFRLPLRQTEGLVGSIIHLLGVELAFPNPLGPAQLPFHPQPARPDPIAFPTRKPGLRIRLNGL
jgi:Transposase DDE domain